MTVLVVHHRVADFGAWKPVFDEHAEVRRKHGARRHWVYRTVDDAADVVVAIDFPSPDAAQSFLADPSLRDAMSRARVEGEPTVHFREELEAVDY